MFVTHRGLYRYKRLTSDITSAPEKYQKIVSDVLQGCEGDANIADDVIVHGCGIELHAKNLLAVLGQTVWTNPECKKVPVQTPQVDLLRT